MSQQDFDNFKQRLKDWMNSHQEEYDQFEEEMNRKDSEGYQIIMTKAMVLIPEYQNIIKKKMNAGNYEDFSEIDILSSNSELAKNLINEFENPDESSIVPVVLCWLYFGKSFERMVEKGEELKNNPETPFFQKQMIAYTIKMLMSQSVKLGLRTKEYWKNYNKLKKAIDKNEIMDWAMEQELSANETIAIEKKKPGRKKNEKNLSEMLSDTPTDKPDNIIDRIGEHLITKHSQQDLAFLKIALEELLYIYPCEVKPFRDALAEQYGDNTHIVVERGIQKALEALTDYMSSRGIFVKDLTENREQIDKIKEILSE